MTPYQLSECLNIVAESIENSVNPSRLVIASDLRAILAAVDSDDEHTAGVMSWLADKAKNLIKTDNEKGIITKIKKIDARKESIPVLIRKIKEGKDIQNIVNDEETFSLLREAFSLSEPSGSDKLQALVTSINNGESTDSVGASAADLRKFWGGSGVKKMLSDQRAIAESLTKYAEALGEKSEEFVSVLNEHQKEHGKSLYKTKEQKEKEKEKEKEKKKQPAKRDDTLDIHPESPGPGARPLTDNPSTEAFVGLRNVIDANPEYMKENIRKLEALLHNLQKDFEAKTNS